MDLLCLGLVILVVDEARELTARPSLSSPTLNIGRKDAKKGSPRTRESDGELVIRNSHLVFCDFASIKSYIRLLSGSERLVLSKVIVRLLLIAFRSLHLQSLQKQMTESSFSSQNSLFFIY